MGGGRQAVDMGQCGPWRSAGIERWNVVDRSWCVFARNTHELLHFLGTPYRDPSVLLTIVNRGPVESSGFWEELDQRLHNHLSSATSLVDHTRRLLKYYEDEASDFVSEVRARNEVVRNLKQAAFLRDLRNYLLHYGTAPVVVSMSLAPPLRGEPIEHAIKLSASRLLGATGWSWKREARTYLDEFGERDGPVILDDVATYAKAMQGVYDWLFEQRSAVVRLTPERFMVPWPVGG